MLDNLFGGFGGCGKNNDIFLILIVLLLFSGDGCGGGMGDDILVWVILLFLLFGSNKGFRLQE
jgi:uncharacterized ion transporter superfamily protein YfcC